MRKTLAIFICGLSLLTAGTFAFLQGQQHNGRSEGAARARALPEYNRALQNEFTIEVLVNNRTLEELYARGRRYIEAQEGAEYALRIHNPLGERIAVALAVDGLNTIDARRTTAWNASKWVIQPYQTITVRGWQMSSNRARRFYFTTEQDSYANRINRPSDMGVISAVFFREREDVAVASPPSYPRSNDDSEYGEQSAGRRSSSDSSSAPSSAPSSSARATESRRRSSAGAAQPDDTHAATGIGQSVRNNVNWVNLDLDPNPYSQVTMRYEYRDALVRLGVIPRRDRGQEVIRRRENSTGFSDNRRYSPEP